MRCISIDMRAVVVLIVMVVGFTITCAISAYHHYRCEFESSSWQSVLDQHYLIMLVSDLRHICGFLHQ